MESHVKIFSGRHSMKLAEKIAKSYGVSLGNIVLINLVMVNFNHLMKKP